jgi:uncharacterized protein (TIGR02145 family)
MKTNISLKSGTLLSLAVLALISTHCKKNDESPSVTPTVNTNSALYIGQNWGTLTGSVNAAGGTFRVSFQWDTSTAYRNNSISDPDTATGSSYTTVNSNLTGLRPGTVYYYRALAVTSSDTTYGDDETFTTTNPGKSTISFNPGVTYGSLTDIDNNIYKTIVIGTQTWMAENLKTTRFNDGTNIPFITSGLAWADLSTAGYSWYNNDSVVYGALYNWHAAAISNLCPAGWHVPGDADWTILTNYLGGESIAGEKLKESGTTHWLTTQSGATNEAGFTALPGGYRFAEGSYGNIRKYGFWWSSTESSSAAAYCIDISNAFSNTYMTTSVKNSGFSVRCVKD